MGDEELSALAREGGLTDAKTLIGLQWWRQWRQGGWPLAWESAEHATLRP